MKDYLKKNPDKCVWKRSDKLKSIPCETLKNILRENGISFVEEFKPLPDRFFSIDIAFPDKKIGIEVNGTQHYNSDGSLKEYYENRKLEIEKTGWELFDVHYSKVYKDKFINDFVLELKTEYDFKNIDYSFYIKENNKKTKPKSYKEYIESVRKNNFENKHSKRINLILNFDIDFKKRGWVSKVSKLINIPHTNVNKWMKKYMLEFYEKECLKKVDKLGLSKVRKFNSIEDYYNHRKKTSSEVTDFRIKMMKDSNIRIDDKYWYIKLMKLFNLSRTIVFKWVSGNKEYILSKF